MNKPPTPDTLILASKSPRRRDLLSQAGLTFKVVPSTLNEKSLRIHTQDKPEEYVRILAEAKAHEVARQYRDSWIIGADTMVVINDTVLGKPRDRAEARHMLETLSGKTHKVFTGYCICCTNLGKSRSETVKTNVQFKQLASLEIDWYIDTQEPFDKAGGYAVQGFGSVLIKRIEGSYTNVVGLPLCEVVEYLLEQGLARRAMKGWDYAGY